MIREKEIMWIIDRHGKEKNCNYDEQQRVYVEPEKNYH